MSYEDKDPKTVEAIDKIKAILIEYDLWAAMTIVSPERQHWLYHIDPSWSCLTINEATGEARMRAKVADFKTQEGHQRVVTLTIGAILCTRTAAAKQFGVMDLLKKMLAKEFDITHVTSDLEIKR